MQKFIFNEPETCFNATTGRKIADDVIETTLFRNQWTANVFADKSESLIDEKGCVIAGKVAVCEAVGTNYVVENEDGTRSLFNADGKVLFDKVQDIALFNNGWVFIYQNGVKALYRDDLTLFLRGLHMMDFTPDNEFVLITKQTKMLWTIYRKDGSVLADEVRWYYFLTPTFYWLEFDDKTVVYDDDAHTQFVCDRKEPCLLEGKTFQIRGDNGRDLYRTDGTKLLSGYWHYRVNPNGTILARVDEHSMDLFNANLELLQSHVTGMCVVGYHNFLLFSDGDKTYLYDDDGKLIRKADNLDTCGGGYFLEKQNNQELGVLLDANMKVVENNVYCAEVFDNGWMLLLIGNPENDKVVYELRNNEGKSVATSRFKIYYHEEFKVWFVTQDEQKFSLCHETHGCVVNDADRIVFYEALAFVKRGNLFEIYSLTQMNACSSNDEKEKLQLLLPIWSGAKSELKKTAILSADGWSGLTGDFYLLMDENSHGYLGFGYPCCCCDCDDTGGYGW